MSRKLAAVAALCVASFVGEAAAQVDPAMSFCTVTFNRVYPANSQLAGQPVQYVTIAPDGTGETFFNANGVLELDGLPDIDITVTLNNAAGFPVVGFPAAQIVLFNPALEIKPGGNIADGPTDIIGAAHFTRTLAAGGCVNSLDVFAGGLFIGTLQSGGITVKTNSPDYAHQGTSPCFTDAADLAFFATQLGKPAAGRICSDFNELGLPNIDAGDVAAFAAYLGAACQ